MAVSVLLWYVGSLLRHVGSFIAARGLLSSCGVRLFSSSCGAQAPGHMGSVVVARGFQSTWALIVCGTQAL